MPIYLQWHWRDAVPGEDPVWVHYEVDQPRDVVLRIVELYSDGTAIRNSIDLAEREGPDLRPPAHRSLLHGPFLHNSDLGALRDELVAMSAAEFERVWDRASDRPRP